MAHFSREARKIPHRHAEQQRKANALNAKRRQRYGEMLERVAELDRPRGNIPSCDEVVFVTEVSLEGWFFPGPWVNGNMSSARYCSKAHLGLCDNDHLHAAVMDIDDERADFRWDMSQHLIHAPIQQVQMAAVIIMEASSEAENILQRYVAQCTVTNVNAIVTWCEAPFCSDPEHPVLVDATQMGANFTYKEEEAAVGRLPWVLPVAVPGWPIRLRNDEKNMDKTQSRLWRRLYQSRGEGLSPMGGHGPFAKAVRCHELKELVPLLSRRTTSDPLLICVGNDIVKDKEAWKSSQKTKDGLQHNSFPKRVYDVETGEIVSYTANTEYTALSYVWAQHSEKTTLSTIRKLSAELGTRYWWVDRLCM